MPNITVYREDRDLHLIPKDRELWKIENFEPFIKAREKLILEKFSFMLHKSTGA